MERGNANNSLYLLAVLVNAANLFLQVFFTIMYSDLGKFFVPSKRARGCWAARPASI